MSDQCLLEVSSLSVSYGRVEAVHQIDLRIAPGQIVTLIGPNGAGKTTALSALMGMLPCGSGSIRFLGENVQKMDVEERVTRGIALVPESRALFSQMSVEDNLLMGAYCRHQSGHRDHMDNMELVYETFPRLRERRLQITGTLSGGERQMVAIGRALMGKPRLLMLDEPSLGLAPLIVREVFQIIAGLRKIGVSVLLVEQNARAALAVADYGYVLELGKVSLHGSATILASDERISHAYLGAKASIMNVTTMGGAQLQ